MVKNLPANAGEETRVLSLGQEDPLEKVMATHSSILVYENLMDRGAWWAMVHGFAKSRTCLKRLSTHIGTDYWLFPLIEKLQRFWIINMCVATLRCSP